MALDLAEELNELGHENEVIALVLGLDGASDAALPALIQSASLRPHMRALAAWKLRRLLAREPVDVVLAHGGTPAQVAIMGFPRHRPAVVWQQILGFPAKVYKQPRRLLWSAVARQVDGAVALTKEDSDELRAVGVTGPLWVIPNFRRPARFFDIDRDTEAKQLRTQIGVEPATPLIGFVGYLVDQKRPERALDVLARVRDAGVPAHLVVAGDGPLRAMLEHVIRERRLQEHVTLLGHCDDVEHVFGGVDVALLTSDEEGIPGVAIEAAMTGCPFVTFALGGVGEVVIDGVTGIVIPEQDTKAMAERVAELLRDDETRQRIGEEARRRSAAFAAPERAKEYAEFLDRCRAGAPAADGRRCETTMRVCIFLPSLSGGGAESSMLRIAAELVARGHDVDLLTARADQAPNNRPDPHLHYRTFAKRHARSAVAGLSRHLRKTRPDVLLTAMDHANVAGIIAARLSGTRLPVVVTYHSDVTAATRNTRGLVSRVRPAFARWTIDRSALAIGVSEGVKASLQQIAPRTKTKIEMIYNPTVRDGLFELAAEPVAALGDFELSESILAVGRLSPEKGYDVMLDAFARVAQTNPRPHLLILGEGPLRDDLERLAQSLGVADRVHLLGYVDNPYQYMARCGVFAFASRWEGLPTVLVEAGVLGCTIVATDCPSGPRELLENRTQATLVGVDNVPAFTAALLAALDRPRSSSRGDWHEHTMSESGECYERVLHGVVVSDRAKNHPGADRAHA